MIWIRQLVSTVNIVDTIDTIYAEISVDKSSIEEGEN